MENQTTRQTDLFHKNWLVNSSHEKGQVRLSYSERQNPITLLYRASTYEAEDGNTLNIEATCLILNIHQFLP
jgi:hypothetical protein